MFVVMLAVKLIHESQLINSQIDVDVKELSQELSHIMLSHIMHSDD